MVIETIQTPAGLEALSNDWTDLHAATRGSPFMHPAWCLAWLDSFPSRRGQVVVERALCGRLDAVLPLAVHPRRPRRLATLGAPLVDFGLPLLRSGRDAAGTIARMLDTLPDWRSVRMIGLPPAVAAGLAAVSDSPGLVVRVEQGDNCPWIDASSVAAWQDVLTPGRHRRLRAATRQVARLGGDFRELIELDDVLAGLRRFEALRLQSWWHSGRWGELPPEVRGTAHGKLLASIAIRSSGAPYPFMTVAEIHHADRVLASAVLLWARTSVLIAVAATDKRLGPSLSPGLALGTFIIRRAIARGATRIDFGRGDEPYKFSLGAKHRPTVDVTMARGTLLRRPRRAIRKGQP